MAFSDTVAYLGWGVKAVGMSLSTPVPGVD